MKKIYTLKKIRRVILRAFAKIKKDRNHWRRKTIGVVLIICGLIGPFVPILGLWMLPLGIILLSADKQWYKDIQKRMRHRRKHRHQKAKQRQAQKAKKKIS